MENRELSLEDKVKPYLILAKTLQKQGKEELTNLILLQMLKQVKIKELTENFYLLEGFPKDFILDDIEFEENKSIPMSTLIDSLKLESLEDIKKVLEKAEKEHNG